MRGSLSLFKDFETEIPQQTNEERKERIFHAKKCEALVDRFFYYGKFTDKRYTKILEHLSEEFFLSQITIAELLDDNSDMLRALKQSPPENKSMFVKKWPHLIW